MRGRYWFHVCCRWLQGRLIDHLRNTQSVGLEDLQALVLDEADRLLQMGFAEEVSCWRSISCLESSSNRALQAAFQWAAWMSQPVHLLPGEPEEIFYPSAA